MARPAMRGTPAQQRRSEAPAPAPVAKFQTIEEQEIEHYLGELFDTKRMRFSVQMRPMVLFHSYSRIQMIHPLGPPRKQIVNSPGGSLTSAIINKPEVLFENHIYEANDANIAAGLILHENFEKKSWGWWIEADGCMPKTLSGIYAKVGIDAKRKIALGLLRGEKDAEIRENLTEEDLAPATDAQSSDGKPLHYSLHCPYPGCQRTASFDGENAAEEARALLAQHTLIVHKNAPISKPAVSLEAS